MAEMVQTGELARFTEIEVAMKAEARCEAARRRDERGLTTAEYAMGVVMVVVFIGVVIAALKMGFFSQLVQTLVGAIFKMLMRVIGG